jgi:nitrite reductase/ring-hydroxylating ferredoxin subunit
MDVASWHEAAKLDDIAPGGMKTVRVEGVEVTVCNVGGELYGVGRRCGHMNAPLECGTLEGWIVTCPLHCARFDVRSGECLAWPLDRDPGPDPLPETQARYEKMNHRLQWKIRVHDLPTYPVRVVDGGTIEVEV